MVLSRDSAIPRLRRALVGPCTTTIRGIPSEVLLEPGEDPVPQASVVNLDFVESVPVAALVHRLGRVSDERMSQICRALAVAVAAGLTGPNDAMGRTDHCPNRSVEFIASKLVLVL